MKPILEIKGISKKFRLSHIQQPYASIRDSISSVLRMKGKTTTEEFWALKDISFDVYPGESVGIIGKNGAGKSTLLKILSKITPPTSGKIVSRGRIASLLEVGTGFHPELTGRENIFLNGSILGMKRKEIQAKFDEIVDFSGVEKFLDTPLKHYSSGMQLRLAFAVAAFLEPEIMVIDEVLAVGDAEFQKKCMGKMDEVSKSGRTILFVSHNMGAISQLCPKTKVLKNGSLFFEGVSSLAIDHYLSNSLAVSTGIKKETIATKENQFKTFINADSNNQEKYDFRSDEKLGLLIEVYLPEWNPNLELAISLMDKYKKRIFTIHEPLQKYYKGEDVMKFKIDIPSSFITPGNYSWLLCINYPGNKLYDVHEDIASFIISEIGSTFSRYEGLDYGCVFANYEIQKIT